MSAFQLRRFAARIDLRFAARIALCCAAVSSVARAQNVPAKPPAGDPAAPSAQEPAVDAAAPAAATEIDAAAKAPAEPGLEERAAPTTAKAPAEDAEPAKDEAAAAAAVEAELAAATGAHAEDSDLKLNLYGFADFTFTQSLKKHSFALPYSTFYVGNLNLYMGAELGDNWRSLTEVRFLYLPHGANTAPPGAPDQSRVNTSVPDYADIERPVRWGGIEIERAWLEHTLNELLTVRLGQWLTPYGIWNVDHGSPVIIGTQRPYVIGEGLLPERQTGIELYGTASMDATQLGYHLTLSNGRGPIDAYRDLDHNKAVGGRLFLRNDSELGTITIGASGYRGQYTDRRSEATFTSAGEMVITHPITAQFDELGLAADLKWEKGGLLVQSEALMNDTSYGELRPIDPGFSGGPPGYTPDNRRYGVYGLAGYRTSFLNAMPFLGAEYYRIGKHVFVPDSGAFWAGLNVRPTPRVVLKGQYTHVWFPTEPAGAPAFDSMDLLALQAAWSF